MKYATVRKCIILIICFNDLFLLVRDFLQILSPGNQDKDHIECNLTIHAVMLIGEN